MGSQGMLTDGQTDREINVYAHVTTINALTVYDFKQIILTILCFCEQ